MDTSEIVVVVAGIALMAAILWYFFGKREAVQATAGAAGVQEVDIVVKGGYSPDRIVVKKGQSVRLKFNRQETSSCTDQVLLGDFGIVKDLPAFKTTAVDFTPDKAGEYTFTCGMNMVHGKLIVQ